MVHYFQTFAFCQFQTKRFIIKISYKPYIYIVSSMSGTFKQIMEMSIRRKDFIYVVNLNPKSLFLVGI